jgi:hypothetical protein
MPRISWRLGTWYLIRPKNNIIEKFEKNLTYTLNLPQTYQIFHDLLEPVINSSDAPKHN